MKKLLTLKNVLIAIAFTVLLLLIKDNLKFVWNVITTIFTILKPFFIGFMIAYILNFPYKFLHDKAFKKMGTKRKFLLRIKKPLAITLTFVFAAAIVAALVVIVVPQIVVNISNLIKNLPSYGDTAMKYLNDIFVWVNGMFGTNYTLDAIYQNAIDSVTKYFSSDFLNTADATKNVLGFLSNIVTSTASGVYTTVMSIIISVYFLSAKDQLCREVKRVTVAFVPIRFLPKVYEIVDITDTKCGRFLVGDILDSAFIGLLTYIVMAIVQIPYAPLIAVLVGVTNIVPFFGPYLGAIPSAFILLLIDPVKMFIFIGIVFLIQQLDGNVIKPKIIGNQLGISSFWVLFSVIVGGALFGVVGFILGTPIYAVIYTLIAKEVKNRIKNKGKIAQEALDFEVLNYSKIDAEQRRLREEKEKQKLEKIKKFIHHEKTDEKEDTPEDDQ